MTIPKLLIDGYNLLFQSELVGKGRGPDWLKKARSRLLQLLHSRLSDVELASTEVIFDAPKFGVVPQRETLPSGMSVAYAIDHDEADDLLEEIIRQHPTPKLLSVVSSDQRVRRCARSRRALSLDSQEFLDDLERRRPKLRDEQENPAEIEPISLSDAEVDFWLKEFDAKSKSPED